MIRTVYFSFILTLLSVDVAANISYNKDSLVRRLDKTMDAKEYFIGQKAQKIDFLKQMLTTGDSNMLQEYNINKRLYDEYAKYQSDSALFYLKQNKELANTLNDRKLIVETEIQMASMYSTVGLFVESKGLLDEISTKELDQELLADYYETFTFYYDHYGQNNEDDSYYKTSELYRDSLVSSITDTLSLKSKILHAEDLFYNHNTDKAEEILVHLLAKTSDNDKERALIAYLLGAISKERGDSEMQEQYFIISAIVDVTNAIRNNASLQSLALTYYKSGNIDRAYKFMKSAIDDALFCNVRYRASEGLSSYPVINASYQAKEAEQKEKLRVYLLLISALLFLLVVALVYVYKQMKRVSRIRKELYQTSVKLLDLNQEMKRTNIQLKEANVQLSEVNHVKEEYIAQFFDLCSAYIEKIEDYRVSLNKLAVSKQLPELFRKLKSTSFIDDELDALYKKFDNIFISLYPSFVEEFNALLREDEQIVLKSNELLNTELRIFALIRLGITDSTKIANFLRYSLSTIYNYRTSARNKAIVSRNEFENRIMTIGIIQKDR